MHETKTYNARIHTVISRLRQAPVHDTMHPCIRAIESNNVKPHKYLKNSGCGIRDRNMCAQSVRSGEGRQGRCSVLIACHDMHRQLTTSPDSPPTALSGTVPTYLQSYTCQSVRMPCRVEQSLHPPIQACLLSTMQPHAQDTSARAQNKRNGRT